MRNGHDYDPSDWVRVCSRKSYYSTIRVIEEDKRLMIH